MTARWFLTFGAAVIVWVVALTGCRDKGRGPDVAPGADDLVRVYCSVDEPFARKVFAEFERRSGVRAQPLLDTEAGKTTGLVNRIRNEAGRPRADVFWSSEIFNTILLAREGLLETYRPPTAEDIPAPFKDPEGRWTAIGLRGRVIVFDSSRTPPDHVPTRWADLAAEQWRGRVAMANPQFGTTRGHVASWFALWGRERATQFLQDLRDHEVIIADGNSAVVRQVMAGKADLGMTDTDDVWVARRQRPTLDLVYADQGDGATLWIPNTIALLRGAPHAERAKCLIDFLVSADVEEMLARSDSGNVPVRASLRDCLEMVHPAVGSRSYQRIADHMPEAIDVAREILLH